MNILLVDDERNELDKVYQATKNVYPNANITTYDDEKMALEYLKENAPDIIVLDIILKEEHGYAMCHKITKIYPEVIVILLTSSLNAIDTYMAERCGAKAFAIKTADMESYKEILEKEISQMVT